MSEVAKETPEAKDGKDGSTEMVVDAINLMAQGKRNLVCGEIPQAVSQLQEASRLLAAKYGETADECAEAYFFYGRALLDLSRMESGVLGNALQGMSEDDEDDKSADSADDSAEDGEKMTEEEKEKLSEQVIDAMVEREEEIKAKQAKKPDGKGDGKEEAMDTDEKQEKSEGQEEKKENSEKSKDKSDKKDEKSEEKSKDEKSSEQVEDSKDESEKKDEKDEKSESGDAEKKEAKDTESESKADTEEDAESEDIADEEGEGTEEDGEESEKKEGEEEKEEKEEEDVSNLQLAWEMLELAKVIFKRHEQKEMKLKLAETHLKLGEVGLETEQYEQAVGDFKQCLAVQKGMLEPEDRPMAETYYQLGLACTYNYKYDEATENYRNAANIIEAKIAKLTTYIEEAEKEGKGKDKVDFDCPVYKARKEVDELKEILPDMLLKIDEVQEEKKSAEQVKQLVKENVSKEMGAAFAAASSSDAEQSTSSTKADSEVIKPVDISHLVRKKRKTEVEDEEEKTKKQKTEDTEKKEELIEKEKSEEKGASNEKPKEEEKPTENGAEATNGVANGVANGKPSPEKTEIKTKTVEDVKQQAEQMDTAETSS